MEQPSSSDGLQPQDLSSTCSLPSVFHPAGDDEEGLLKPSPVEALNVLQTSGWFVSPGTSNGFLTPEPDSGPSPLPTDQIQPDDALSNTTVTLSYVSRSHVFSDQDPLSENSQIYGVPPLSKAFVLHPSTFDASKLATDTGDAVLSLDMDQPCLQQVSVPVGITACDQFGFMSPAQVVENVAALCYLQQPPDLSGLQDVESIALEALRSLQQTNPAECRFPVDMEELQSRAANGLWNIGPFEEGFSEEHAANTQGLHRNGNPEVVFLISRSEEPVILQNNQGPASFAIPLHQDFIGPLDPESPPAASVDEMNVFSLPQAANSPSGENVFVRETVDAKQEHYDKEMSDLTKAPVDEIKSPSIDSLSEFITSLNQKPSGNTDKTCNTKSVQVNSVSAGERDTEAFQTTDSLCNTDSSLTSTRFERKKLPPRTRRGMRLGAIVQNIHPTRCKSSHVTKAKRAQKGQIFHLDSSQHVSPNKKQQPALEGVCSVEKVVKSNEKMTVCLQEEETDVRVSHRCKTTAPTSRSTNKSVPKLSLEHKPTETLDVVFCSKKRSRKPQRKVSEKSSAGIETLNSLPILKASRKPRSARLSKTIVDHKDSAAVKKSHVCRRKRKKHKVGHSFLFSPQEPDIKLKCLNNKGERKNIRSKTFAPYVHVELNSSSACTVVNYPEESFRLKHGKQQLTAGSGSSVVPASPCLQYGRICMDGTQRGALVCCLCGGSANATDLGDLHGPYYPESLKSAPETLTNPQGDEEERSDSDSSFCPEREKWVHSTGDRSSLKRSESAALMSCQRWSSDSETSSSPAVKQPRVTAVSDWYSPPVVLLRSGEYWLHEECAVWSAGVVLVRGKLYGLENAVRLAKESVCSACQNKGATLGCVFKGCSNKYHFTCAMQTGCVLNQDNFSIKCRKHKNKSMKGSCHPVPR